MSKKIKKKQNRTILIERFEIDGALFAKDIKTGEQGIFLSSKQFTQIQDELGRLRHLQTSSKGGTKSVVTRRARAKMGWQAHALDLAIQARKANPKLSQDGVVSRIIPAWSSEKGIAPPTLKKFVSNCEKDGRLQPRKK